MRTFTKQENDNMSFLVNHSINFTIVQITATGLKKSILDATAPMRTFFYENGIHDYSKQKQGKLYKVKVPTYIMDDTKQIETFTSMYRPLTKKGDPRLWVYNLGNFTEADDIHAISFFEEHLIIVNITKVDIEKCYKSAILTPLKELIGAAYEEHTLVSEELLGIFKGLSGQWFESEVKADTGIGRTIESMLGISQNSYTGPDYKGIELKSHRDKRSSKKNVLFTQTPQWDLSTLKSGREIVKKYGYDCGDGRLTYQNTVQCQQANSQGLVLSIDKLAELLELQYSGERHEDIVVWRMQKLHKRLVEKHHETFWIEVENEIYDNKEFFRYKSIEYTRNPVVSQFDVLLESAMITIDLLLSRPSGHGDTYSFKIKKKGMPMLFPESCIYNLLHL